MSGIVIQDSGRAGKLSWAESLITSGVARGMLLSPWETPPHDRPRRPGIRQAITTIGDAHGIVLLDPETYGCFVPGVDKTETYDDWRLWPEEGPAKELNVVLDHAERVARAQLDLGLPLVAPTLALESPAGADAQIALALAEFVSERNDDSDTFLGIVGTSAFWKAGNELDAFVGRLARLRPTGWIVGVVRSGGEYPWVDIDGQEVAGLCRTVHSLSARGTVIVNRSDLAGIVTVVAGSDLLGSGWDLKQRVLSGDLYRHAPGIRRTSPRVTHEGLLASLKRQEAERLRDGRRTLSARLVPGDLPLGSNGHWQHHLRVLSRLVESVSSAGDASARYVRLRELYQEAEEGFRLARPHARPLEADYPQWIRPLDDGLIEYATAERL